MMKRYEYEYGGQEIKEHRIHNFNRSTDNYQTSYSESKQSRLLRYIAINFGVSKYDPHRRQSHSDMNEVSRNWVWK